MNLSDDSFIGLYDNVISQKSCEKIISYFDRVYDVDSEKFDCSYGGNETAKGEFTRCDHQIFLSEQKQNPIRNVILDIVDNYHELYKTKYWTSNLIELKFEEIKLQKTPPRGGFHDWHCEINDLRVVDRCVAWMLYLNDIPEGEGETEFLWQGIRVQPKVGRLLIWPAFYTHTHRGNAVYSTNKYIATGWGNYTYQGEDVRKHFEFDEETSNYTGRK